MHFFRTYTKFESAGEFRGFIENAKGKTRMLLATPMEQLELKLPKEIRRIFEGKLALGQPLEVNGFEERDRFSGESKLVVKNLQIVGGLLPVNPGEQTTGPLTLRVCAKKNCWKSGGKELWKALEEEIEQAGLAGRVKLKAVNCLDHCKHAPNLACGEMHVERCTPDRGRRLLAEVAGHGRG